jgi:hypothetical protein
MTSNANVICMPEFRQIAGWLRFRSNRLAGARSAGAVGSGRAGGGGQARCDDGGRPSGGGGDFGGFALVLPGSQRRRTRAAGGESLGAFPNISFAHAKAAGARHGLWTLTAAKFLPGTVMPSLAGALGMSTRQFLLCDGLAALFFAGCYVIAGFIFHDQVQQVIVWFYCMCHGVIGLGVVLVVGYVGYKYALRRRNKRPARRTDLAEKGVDAYAGIPCLDAAKLAAEK